MVKLSLMQSARPGLWPRGASWPKFMSLRFLPSQHHWKLCVFCKLGPAVRRASRPVATTKRPSSVYDTHNTHHISATEQSSSSLSTSADDNENQTSQKVKAAAENSPTAVKTFEDDKENEVTAVTSYLEVFSVHNVGR